MKDIQRHLSQHQSHGKVNMSVATKRAANDSGGDDGQDTPIEAADAATAPDNKYPTNTLYLKHLDRNIDLKRYFTTGHHREPDFNFRKVYHLNTWRINFFQDNTIIHALPKTIFDYFLDKMRGNHYAITFRHASTKIYFMHNTKWISNSRYYDSETNVPCDQSICISTPRLCREVNSHDMSATNFIWTIFQTVKKS